MTLLSLIIVILFSLCLIVNSFFVNVKINSYINRYSFYNKYNKNDKNGFLMSIAPADGTETTSATMQTNKNKSLIRQLSNKDNKISYGIFNTLNIKDRKIFNNMNQLLSISITETNNNFEKQGEEKVNLKIIQKTTGPVPRSYLPSLVILSHNNFELDNINNEAAIFSLVEEGLKWYLDVGGRVGRVEFLIPNSLLSVFDKMKFSVVNGNECEYPEVLELRQKCMKEGYSIVSATAAGFRDHSLSRINGGLGDLHTLWDIVGRLTHDMGNPSGSIKPYTSALQENPSSAAVFRNLGSAYHGVGDMQLAFASYQQAVQLDPQDALVYLKLAFFYEDFATKDWIDAAQHSQKCYEYYLENIDPEDTSILTRLGNLLVREHLSEEAIKTYDKALKVDSNLVNVWHNKALAQVKIGDNVGASESLKRTLELDPTITAARHMLTALSDDEALKATSADDNYIKDLFNSYAQIYDNHGKKLLYSAPRVIRQELAKIYKDEIGKETGTPINLGTPTERNPEVIACTDHPEELHKGQVNDGGCATYTSFVNATKDILDIGCGTGLAGAWLKDYARNLVGVDLSEQMVNVARKKQLYQELHVMPMSQYLDNCSKTYDIVVAADVLSYVGDLSQIFKQVSKVLRPGALFAFTVEAALSEEPVANVRGYRLLPSGRFGYRKEYIDNLINELGGNFVVPLAREFSPRLDSGSPIPGYLYIIKKSS